MDWLTWGRWSPYVVGAGMGVVTWLSFLFSDRGIGCSTPIAKTAGMIERLFRGNKTMERPYYKAFPPIFGWGSMLLVGILIGAFISSVTSGTFELKWVPDLWAETIGPAVWVRIVGAFIGGILMGIGARWAGGCTSGHGISGALQLAVSSWIAIATFFAGGIVTAFLLYRVLAGVF